MKFILYGTSTYILVHLYPPFTLLERCVSIFLELYFVLLAATYVNI